MHYAEVMILKSSGVITSGKIYRQWIPVKIIIEIIFSN